MWVLLSFVLDIPVFILDHATEITSLVFTIIVCIFVYKQSENRTIRINKTAVYFYLIAIVAAVLFMVFMVALSRFYTSYIEAGSVKIFHPFRAENLLEISAWSTIILAPLKEELFFRQYLQKNLNKRYNGILVIAVVALLFGAIHLPFPALFLEDIDFSGWQAFHATFGGVISGTLFYYSKSIGPSLLYHACWNFIAVTF